MVPYVTVGAIDIFGFELQPFFLLVIIGVLTGVFLFDRICKRGGPIDRRVALHFPEVCLVFGFIGAHLVHVLFYHPELMKDDAWVLFKIWGGYSSFGGFLGGFLGGIIYLKLNRVPVMPYGDRVLFALLTGWIFGRTGCAVTHDHPGIHTDFFLGVKFPDGVRHDLGFYELLVTIALVGILYLIARRPHRTGTIVGALILIYSPIRFFFDFLRVTEGHYADSRFLGLTPAQYGMILMTIAGIALLATAKRRPMDIPFFGAKPDAAAEAEFRNSGWPDES